uniref:HMA domain-containing protein n=1 Tax=Ananas comosus var. bracteatus TaxID=296719 RepID=A0A6V7PL43_ANACO|nr:unnamed protein product [Ananas comosus var. bracteatus]
MLWTTLSSDTTGVKRVVSFIREWNPMERQSESTTTSNFRNVSVTSPGGSKKDENKTKQVEFRIRGIKCASCAVSIESVVANMKGVESISVSPLQGQAVVFYKPELTNAQMIKQAIEDLNYEVDEFLEQEIAVCRLRIKGMACTSCSESVEKALLMADGVKKAVVGLALHEAKIHFDPNITNANRLMRLLKMLEDANLIQSVLEAADGVNTVELDPSGQKVIIAYDPELTGPRTLIQCIEEAVSLQLPVYGPCFLVLYVLPMFSTAGDWLSSKVYNNLTVGMLLRWVLCTPVQFIIGWRFYIGTYHALKRGSSNMDVLVALGTNAAYFYSVYIVLKALTSQTFEGEDFFETSAMLISFILLGKYLEIMAKGKTSDALAKLTDLAPDTAVLLDMDKDGNVISEMEISTQLLQRNDVIKIVPGAKVPVDGVVIKVIGGTVNESGWILVKATRVGSETALSQIVQLVEAAQLARAPVQKIADRISRFFVPTVVMAAFITWLSWFICGKANLYPRHWIPKAMDEFELALQFGISVLVIACPCALGLATPTAVMVATGKGASQGVLIKGGYALEKAHNVKAVVFDKTGTLTIGKPSVVQTMLFSKMPLQELCDLAAVAESNSEHPLAKAIVEYAKKLHEQYGSTLIKLQN